MNSATRPDPVLTPESAFFWEGAARGELLGQRCGDCGRYDHPPRPMCPACHSVKREIVRLSGCGVVDSWIVPRHPPPVGFFEPPIVALIALEEGVRIVSNVVGVAVAGMRTGLPVEVCFEPTVGGHAVPVFRPHDESSSG